KEAKEEGKEKVIIFNLSGHGLMDLVGYQKFMAGELKNTEMSQEELEQSMKSFEGHPVPKF
ncbi:MAG: TrpB-like pyridoxal-phosphate dependent enzyme, partial [Deltaproteobacteria bacterium]|nr:TrpB-like pyridoxal-phosphate dependent enzyme [Deltaproteobacteria bacterium]